MINIHQNPASKSSKVRVTFSMPAIDACERLYLVGWFSESDETVYPMNLTADGEWALTLELEVGCTYQYRFRTLDGRWLCDPADHPASTRIGLNRSFVISRSSPNHPPTRPSTARPG